jgi:hypothetical protein
VEINTEEEAIRIACKMVANEARSYPGQYQTDWPHLQPDTIAHKATGDSPLLETGGLRDSVEWSSSGNVGWVGSNDEKMVLMELGTSKVPPRSVLALAAAQKGPAVAKAVAAVVGSTIAANLAHGGIHDAIEIAKMAVEAARAGRDFVDEHMPDADEGKRR